jgi:hypothetical protein
MAHTKNSNSKIHKLGYGSLLLVALLLTAVTLAISADDRKVETIDATATGTSTQLGKTVNVKVTIYEFSTPEDRQILVDAFKKGQNQGVVNALTKMKAVGRIAITGTLGYASATLASFPPTPDARFASSLIVCCNSAKSITIPKASPTI